MLAIVGTKHQPTAAEDGLNNHPAYFKTRLMLEKGRLFSLPFLLISFLLVSCFLLVKKVLVKRSFDPRSGYLCLNGKLSNASSKDG